MTSKNCICVWRIAIIALGILFIAFGVYLYLNWIEMFTRLRGKEMALSPTSPSYPSWKISPLPLNFDIYLFNWTNPEDYYVGSTKKPHLKQLGPYRFRESPDKVDIEWHNHNHSISFRKKAAFYFDAENSKGSLDDVITTVNTVSHAAAIRAKDLNYVAKKFLQTTLGAYNEGISVTTTARKLMFEGYLDPLVTMGSFISMFSKDIQVPYNRIGYFYTRNNSASFDGHINMYTGADDIRKMGQIHTWNHLTHNQRFANECGEVKGSMGEFFPPNLSTNDSISIYLPNMCRSVPLDYTETVEIHGVTAYKFSGGARAIDNGTIYPEAKCFCVNNKCEASGIINASPCNFNASIYMSYPHFYKADPKYLEAIDGLSPNKEQHEFFMSLEPNAGVVMDVGGGFQANYLLEPVEDISPFDNIPRTFIPLMWCEERVRVTPEIANDIALVPLIILLGQLLTGVLLAGGVILICWYPTKFISQLCQDDPKTKTALLNPLTNVAVKPSITLMHIKKPIGSSASPLLDPCTTESVIRSNGLVTESLLGHTLRSPSNVIIR